MTKTKSKLLAAITLGITALLVSSCSSVGPVETSEPEVSTSKSPVVTENAGENVGAYISFESYSSEVEQYADTNVVLFFNAVWCSTCKLAKDNFEASQSEIPQDLTIVLVDFDDSIELRKKYGVTVQHTFVQIDSSGDAVGKWSGSVTVTEVVEKLA
jgi:thiol-disulfide isomerase/thioredoxin